MNETRSRLRPWFAALLALTVTGLGHAYLRRWLRALGWFAATYAAVLLFVPDAALAAMVGGDSVDLSTLAPPLVVVLSSAVDAFVLARADETAAARRAADDGAPTTCPHCGNDVDPELDFCHWCTAELDGARGGDER
ncbi:DUF7575 domain-containing protein [Halobaculum sp. P14]|uniref:DUF7575 domain-containing protein n=1 Tax=Halobaculum sp. P14 TaxID=3421638 RepID=UPI003EB80319